MKTKQFISQLSNTTFSPMIFLNNFSTQFSMTTMKTQDNNTQVNNLSVTNLSVSKFGSTIRKAVLTLAAVVLVAATQLTFAASGPEPAAKPLESAVFQLPASLKFKAIVAPSASGKLTLSIRNEKGQLVHSENHKNTQGYIRTFDLSSLSDGEYTFEISDGKQTQSKTFNIHTTTARVAALN